MRKHLIFILILISMTFCSWTTPKANLLNTNSWSISIGDKEILASWKGNEMGDTATLDRKTLKLSDTLFVERYLCGSGGQNSITTVTIKNAQDEIIKEAINRDNQWMLTCEMPLHDFLNSSKIAENKIVAVYFTIASKTENKNHTVLLGRLKLN